MIENFNPNVKSINVIYDLQYDRFLTPSMLHKEEIISID
ncbi:hypothetical protein LEP1GSC193_1168 [Leptospira alstonii serovar Pingchang str. 80-412]|uniref:Uncharacterized protein n=2 Tax=Leptospira alstonii TaxID=28452 RepID=M6CRZ3_9LEPT|nr:hypothetical protein LEP1GSC194_2801 [Leptospira alstonii serovar Sichuan str. 79601]EQA82588.1 hypothetical protein LEP1GSC193_1168 [Leptospira alstonii serovar Pingchang str. 80-412]